MTDSDVLLTIVQGENEAQLLLSLLRGHGIMARVAGESLRLTHPVTMNGLAEARIYVRREQEQVARDLLARVEAGELELPEDEDIGDEPPEC